MAPRLALAALVAMLALALSPAAQAARDLLQAPLPKTTAPRPKPDTVLAYACSNPQTTKFCKAATTAIADPKVAVLNDPSARSTVFIPTDAGLTKNAAKVRDELDVNTDDWTLQAKPATRFVQNHIIPNRALDAASLKRGTELKSSLGQDIKVGDASWFNYVVTVGGLFRSNDVLVKGEEGGYAKVITPDVDAGRSVIHVIDGPIIPDDVL